jgi:hypothetical protein
MTVESLVFIGLGILVVVLSVKVAIAENAKRNHAVATGQDLQDFSPTNSNRIDSSNGIENDKESGHIKDLEVSTVGKEKTPAGKECAPTAELQTIDNIEAIQRVQILISKGQTIEAVQYLCDNAGYDKQRALALVDSMGKKVYSSD